MIAMDLQTIRKEIDRIDDEIKSLFLERMNISSQVANIKSKTNDKVFKPDREEEVIKRLTSNVDDNLKKEYSYLIKLIMEISREYQYKILVDLKEDFIDRKLNILNLEDNTSYKIEIRFLCENMSKDLANMFTLISCYEFETESIKMTLDNKLSIVLVVNALDKNLKSMCYQMIEEFKEVEIDVNRIGK